MSAVVQPLWPQPIPIIGGTGEHGSGKTRFGLSICPGPRTLVYDLEQSSASYQYIGFERLDVQRIMHQKYPKGYKPVDLWLWFLDHIRAVPADKYAVIMVDPVTDLERGLTDWVSANPGHFGHTSGQYAKMSGIMWGDVKDYEKMILADITAKCETFYFTAHVGREFKNNTATDNLKAKGKATLHELASLYLWFDRRANAKGEKPSVPTARVVKGRLEVGEVIDGDVVSYTVLPPTMPQATPKAIRAYFANPAGRRSLEVGERAVEEKMSDEDRLRLEVQRAEAERDAAMYKMELAGGRLSAGVPTDLPGTAVSDSSPTGRASGDVVVGQPTPEQFEENFAAGIDGATSEANLDAVRRGIKDAVDRGYIKDTNRTRLITKYNTRLKEIKSGASASAASAAPSDDTKSQSA